MQNIKAIIFDMDGVIVDSEPLHVDAELLTCRHFGIDPPLSEWDNFKGRTSYSIFAYLAEKYLQNRVDAQDMVKYYYQIYLEAARERIAPIEGALDFINCVRKIFPKLALTTSGEKESQLLVFDRFNLHGHFDVVVTGDEITNGKPHPEPYLKTVEKLSFEPGHCIVIEDSDNGIRSAKAAGCRTIGLTTTFEGSTLMQAGADHAFGGYPAIEKFLNI